MHEGPGAEWLSQISTSWTLLRQANAGSPEEARSAAEQLLKRYHGAVRRYLRLTVDEATADDLAQEFAVALLSGRFRHADPEKGRFRNYIRTALVNLIARHKRTIGRSRVQAGAMDLLAQVPSPEEESDHLFDSAWHDELLARTWITLRQVQPNWYEVLRFRAEHPKLSSTEMATKLSEKLGRPFTAESVRQALHRGREKFAELLVTEVSQSLNEGDETDLQEELVHLGLMGYCRPALARRGD